MKIQIRKGVFETNSSSEHSLSIVKKSNFLDWKAGKMYAKRSPDSSEFKETWGNFWSEQYYWSFALMDANEVEEKNRTIFDKNIKNEKESIKLYAEKNKGPECDAYVAYRREVIADMERKGFEGIRPIDKLYDGYWMTYEEYQKALRQDDCYSPFEHINETEDVAVFGKYNHT